MSLHLHVGLIPDGTRRWARKNNVPLEDAYWMMSQKAAKIIDYLYEKKVDIVSLFLSSTASFKRTPSEVDLFVRTDAKFLRQLVPPLTTKWQAKVKIAGCLDSVPIELAEASRFAEFGFSSVEANRKLNILINYNVYDEISHATNKTKRLCDSLWIPDPLDIVIRAGQEIRLSGFLPLQSTRAELFFVDKLINDVDLSDIDKIFQEYELRDRRLGL